MRAPLRLPSPFPVDREIGSVMIAWGAEEPAARASGSAPASHLHRFGGSVIKVSYQVDFGHRPSLPARPHRV